MNSSAHPNALFRWSARGLQDQNGSFFASHGTIVIRPEPSRLFEVPVAGLLPDDLNHIPQPWKVADRKAPSFRESLCFFLYFEEGADDGRVIHCYEFSSERLYSLALSHITDNPL